MFGYEMKFKINNFKLLGFEEIRNCLYATSRPTNTEQVHVKKNIDKKR